MILKGEPRGGSCRPLLLLPLLLPLPREPQSSLTRDGVDPLPFGSSS